jgi:adenylylsulfate kinase
MPPHTHPAIKALVFDLDGTLYSSPRYNRVFEKTILRLVSERLSIEIVEAARRLAAARRREPSLTRRLQALGIPKEVMHEYLSRHLNCESLITPDTRLPYLIRYLRASGFRVCLLTDAGRPLAVRIIHRLGLAPEDFDLFLTGSEAEPKTSLEPFRRVAGMLSLTPSEILYVGDRLLAEIKPAHKAGFRTALVKRGPPPQRTRYVDFRLQSIYELPSILGLGAKGPGLVVWITGIPSSGKTTLVRMSAERLRERGLAVEILESDTIRRRLFDTPLYTERETQRVYEMLLETAGFLSGIGVNVFISATGFRQAFRDRARRMFPRYLEVYAKCSLEVAMARDSQGLYQRALSGEIRGLPGFQVEFEEPRSPDITLRTDMLKPDECVQRIIEAIDREASRHSSTHARPS